MKSINFFQTRSSSPTRPKVREREGSGGLSAGAGAAKALICASRADPFSFVRRGQAKPRTLKRASNHPTYSRPIPSYKGTSLFPPSFYSQKEYTSTCKGTSEKLAGSFFATSGSVDIHPPTQRPDTSPSGGAAHHPRLFYSAHATHTHARTPYADYTPQIFTLPAPCIRLYTHTHTQTHARG